MRSDPMHAGPRRGPGALAPAVVTVLAGCAGAGPDVARLEPLALGSDGSALVALAEPTVAISAGTRLGAHHGGLLRIAQRSYEWGSSFSPRLEGLAATEHLASRGYTVANRDDLAGEEEARSDAYRLDATVVDLAYDTYGGFAGDRSDATLTVDWCLRRAASDEVVFRATTRGFGTQRGTGTECLQPAFLCALDNLLGDAGFVGELRRGPRGADRAVPGGLAPIAISGCACPDDLQLPDDLGRVAGAVIVVHAGGSPAPGVVISSDGQAVTSARAVGGATEVRVRTTSGLELPARVVRADPRQEVALIEIAGRGHACLALHGDARVGDALFVLGAPPGDAHRVATGVLTGFAEIEGVRHLQTDAELGPGDAGAPLLAADGRVVGIVIRSRATADGEPAAFVLQIEDALRRLGVHLGGAAR